MQFFSEQSRRITPSIDLSRLPPPQIIENISYDDILEAMVDDFLKIIKKNPNYQNYELDAADPARKVLEVAAYREMLLRARINEAARQCMVAFATGSNLDHLAALFGAVRDGDDDDSLRERILLAFERFSTAGSFLAYKAQAYRALEREDMRGAELSDVYAYAKDGGDITVNLLFNGQNDSSNVAAQKKRDRALELVQAHLSTREVRPLTDHVVVQLAKIKEVKVAAKLYVPHGVDKERVRQNIDLSLSRFAAERYRIKAAVAAPNLYAAMIVPNVERAELYDFVEHAEDVDTAPFITYSINISTLEDF